MQRSTDPAIHEWFWSKVDRTGDCWLWTAGRSPRGYGRVRYNGSTRRAHRVAWMMTHGPIPDGMYVCHTCDTPPCVNPAHLWLGTNADNLRDMCSKGRQRGPQGERSPTARLTEADVRVVRQRRAEGWTYARIAADFGITFQAVAKIANRQRWKHIT